MRFKLAAIALVFSAGCASPTQPSEFKCYTQPREYWNPATGIRTMEIDWYVQSTPCPATRIE